MNPGPDSIDRRTALTGAGIAAVALTAAACGSSATGSPGTTGAVQQPGSNPLTATEDVPVGGGVIVGDTVVTQPAAGTFLGFSAVCTHLGCTVGSVAGGLIICPCHGSRFHLDGTVARGPAARPLDTRRIRVDGDRILPG
ncbi:ubiquinol-cytochrome c reductase iron-sulfur subunit [Nocardia terpenica]|uniref:Cytochrome bc1 complex Rieske iron-sulfur subunit n=1 Tax=Nocardia terpenica TaxID=455432 RepID=A0A6G9Z8U0_9NOCA|nr:Rieske (2Fe-2S) protein [Nocardia terpenica]QIS21874.1 Rieske 2Fe-2S domain-containing protein [Nocardia terpenica]